MTTRLPLRRSTFSIFFIFLFLSGQGVASAGSQGFKLLEDLEQALVSLADKVRPAVVSLSPYVPPSPSVRRQDSLNKGRPNNAGAGVIIDGTKGLIVTNSHVVKNSDKIQVTLFGGKKLVGRVLGSDDDTDLAVVQIPVESRLASVQFGDSSGLKVGQMVVAVGNPYGLSEEQRKATVAVLENALADDVLVALGALEAFDSIGGTASRSVLALLERPEPELVKEAVICINRHGDVADLEPVVPLVSHPDWSVRAEAIQALADRGVVRAVPPILRRLETEQDEFVRDVILRSLKRLEG